MENPNQNVLPLFKTGMRVPVGGVYEDQFGTISFHDAHRTFPPCIGRKGEAALRRLIKAA
jgi:hypothetical protein